MGKADLHFHTTVSDGMMSPAMVMNHVAACTDLDLINRRQEMPQAEYGASDAHFLWAIGRTWKEYPGQGFAALRRALTARATRAQGLTWRPISLAAYFIDRSRWARFCRQHGVPLEAL